MRKILLILVLLGLPMLVQAGNGGEIQPDEPQQGAIAERDERDTYTFVGSAEQTIRLTASAVSGSMLDTYLELYDPTGDLLASNDDTPSADSTDSEIQTTLPQDGSYTVVVSGFAGASTGEYELLLVFTEGIIETPAPNVGASGLAIALDEAQRGKLEIGVVDIWEYAPQQDERIKIDLFSTIFDPVLELYDAEGRLMAVDDDTGGGLNASISGAEVVAGQTYEIWVRGYQDLEGGEYVITVSTAPPPPAVIPIGYGESAESTLPNGSEAHFEFEGTAGEVIYALIQSDFDSYLLLRHEDGEIIATDDDSGGELQAYLSQIALPYDGVYRLEVSGYSASEGGSFSITLATEPLAGVVPSGTLRYDEPLEGFFEAQAQSFFFSGQAGDAINVTAEAEFDGLLRVYDPEGNLLVEDDDGGEGLNPQIDDLILPVSGEYILELDSFTLGAEGGFSLILSLASAAPAEPIGYGETKEGELGAGENARYHFEARAGDVITVRVNSEFDAFLELRDPDNLFLISDDDSGGDFQPALVEFTLPADGTYTLIVSGFGVEDVGAYHLSLETGAGTPPPPENEGDEVMFGDTVSATLLGEPVPFRFMGNAGDEVTIRVVGDFDGFLELFDPAGALLASDDDSGEGLNPLLEGVRLDQNGEHRLIVSAVDGQGRGDFTLSLTKSATEGVTVIRYGERLDGAFDGEAVRQYVFNGVAGDRISLAAAARDWDGDLDLYLELYLPNGDLLAADDDGSWRLNPALVDVELPETGTYSIDVRSFSGSTQGDFRLMLESGSVYFSPSGTAAQPFPINSTVELSLGANNAALFMLEGTNGALVTFNSSGALAAEIYNPDEERSLAPGDSFELSTDPPLFLLIFSEAGGEDTISLSTTTTASPPTPRPVREIAAGLPVRGRVAPESADTWVFIPLLDGDYTFVLNAEDTSGRYDPFMLLRDDNGSVLYQDDDSGGSFNALLEDVPLSGGERITIEVGSFDGLSGGDYLLAVTAANTQEHPTIQAGEIAPGDSASSALSLAGQQAEFILNISSNGNYSLALEGLKLPYIDVYNGDVLVGRGAAQISSLALAEGSYRVVVFDRLNRVGEFTLSITPE